MNIFEKRESASDAIKTRGNLFVHTAHRIINELGGTNGSDLAPSFVRGYHGFRVEVSPYDQSRWIDNPNYKPGLSSEEYRKPENVEVNAGFHKIEVIDKVCNIRAIELQGGWDDCDGDPEVWKLYAIPQELFLYGYEKDIAEFFKARFKESVEREKENVFRSKWSALFYYYTPEELEMYANAMKSATSDTTGDRFDETLSMMRGS